MIKRWLNSAYDNTFFPIKNIYILLICFSDVNHLVNKLFSAGEWHIIMITDFVSKLIKKMNYHKIKKWEFKSLTVSEFDS
jgi:hypothetical protein